MCVWMYMCLFVCLFNLFIKTIYKINRTSGQKYMQT